MVNIVDTQFEQSSNALRGLGFTVNTLDVTDFVGLWNIKNKHPLENNMLFCERFIDGRKISVEIYFIIDSNEIEVVLQTTNKNYSNDFERMSDVVAMVQYLYAWLQAERRF